MFNVWASEYLIIMAMQISDAVNSICTCICCLCCHSYQHYEWTITNQYDLCYTHIPIYPLNNDGSVRKVYFVSCCLLGNSGHCPPLLGWVLIKFRWECPAIVLLLSGYWPIPLITTQLVMYRQQNWNASKQYLLKMVEHEKLAFWPDDCQAPASVDGWY